MTTDLYHRLGVDTTNLGCVLLDTAPLGVSDMFPEQIWYHGELPGRRPATESHVTLLYGLLRSAHEWRVYVDEVLNGWAAPDVIEVRDFNVYEAAEYDVVVGRVANQAELRDAHHRLSRLPHVNTFPYEPHVTVGYTRKGLGRYTLPELGRAAARLPARTFELPVTGLSYGDRDTP